MQKNNLIIHCFCLCFNSYKKQNWSILQTVYRSYHFLKLTYSVAPPWVPVHVSAGVTSAARVLGGGRGPPGAGGHRKEPGHPSVGGVGCRKDGEHQIHDPAPHVHQVGRSGCYLFMLLSLITCTYAFAVYI